jgi:hypothetical protein
MQTSINSVSETSPLILTTANTVESENISVHACENLEPGWVDFIFDFVVFGPYGKVVNKEPTIKPTKHWWQAWNVNKNM